MKVTVTKEHIKRGKKKNCMRCPIAIAVRSKHPSWQIGKIFIRSAWNKQVKINLPKKAQKFIDAFDSGKPVKPFSFTLKGI